MTSNCQLAGKKLPADPVGPVQIRAPRCSISRPGRFVYTRDGNQSVAWCVLLTALYGRPRGRVCPRELKPGDVRTLPLAAWLIAPVVGFLVGRRWGPARYRWSDRRPRDWLGSARKRWKPGFLAALCDRDDPPPRASPSCGSGGRQNLVEPAPARKTRLFLSRSRRGFALAEVARYRTSSMARSISASEGPSWRVTVPLGPVTIAAWRTRMPRPLPSSS